MNKILEANCILLDILLFEFAICDSDHDHSAVSLDLIQRPRIEKYIISFNIWKKIIVIIINFWATLTAFSI